jgi:predicted membrane channel-forming protein YqfA (hemolysin III family)
MHCNTMQVRRLKTARSTVPHGDDVGHSTHPRWYAQDYGGLATLQSSADDGGLATLQSPAMPSRRDAYYRGGAPRPTYRGAVMTALLPFWPAAVAVHALYCQVALETQLSERSMLRVLVAVATSLNVFFSDRFHNSDREAARLSPKERRDREIFWLRLDFTGISFVLSSTFALWASHFAWAPPFVPFTLLGFAATCTVGVAGFTLFERIPDSRLGEQIIKATLGAQYLVLFGYMVVAALRTPCAPHTVIWFTYLPGFAAYTFQWPKDRPTWGAHDVFHAFVLLGHVMSAGCDAVNAGWECIS